MLSDSVDFGRKVALCSPFCCQADQRLPDCTSAYAPARLPTYMPAFLPAFLAPYLPNRPTSYACFTPAFVPCSCLQLARPSVRARL